MITMPSDTATVNKVTSPVARKPSATAWSAAWAPLAAGGTATLAVLAALGEHPHLNVGIVSGLLVPPYLVVAAILIFTSARPSLNDWARAALCGIAALLSLGAILIDFLAAAVLGMSYIEGFYLYEPGADAFLALVAGLLGMISFVTAVYRASTKQRARG